LLALSGSRRLVIRNGGIAAVLNTTDDEPLVLEQLEAIDARLVLLRNRIRHGERLKADSTADGDDGYSP
jgi:hypothetical protein